jgi:hypothetical protein
MQVLVQIDAWDPVAAAAVSLYAASHDEPDVCHASGGTWWPAIKTLPVLRYDLFDGSFGGAITAPSSSLTLQTEPWPNFARYSFADARLRLWTGDTSDPGNVWTLRFDGRLTAQPQIENGSATIAFAADDRWLDKALLSTYAGTTGAEGPLAMKGQAKPLALGAPRYVPGKLIDSVNSVFQLSAYGAMQSIDTALERLVRFGAPIADYASYALLVAATIPAGQWATAKAVGMARFGAPTTGQVSFLAGGDNAGPDGWARKPGQLIRRLALISGGAGKIDDASLNALDTARPYNLSLYIDGQTTARELIQQIAASVNAVAGVSWTGQLFVAPVGLGTATVTLAADGSSLPPVASVQQIDIAPPWQKLSIGAERAWAVHSLGDIAFTAPLLPLGLYSSGTIYREGNIVDLANGSSWLYINATPASGNAPPGSGTSNTWWFQQKPPTSFAAIAPTESSKLDGIEAAADVTMLITGVPAIDVAGNYDGTVKTGELTDRNVAFKLIRGSGTDVTTSAAWTATLKSGSATATIGSATGVLNVTALASTAAYEVQAVYGGVTRKFTLVINFNLDIAPTGGSGGTGGTSASDSTISGPSSTSYGSAATDVLSVVAGSAGTVTLAAPLAFKLMGVLGTRNMYGKWQWRAVGGSFADVATEILGDQEAESINEPPIIRMNGNIAVSMSKTGLTNGTTYEFQLLLRMASGASGYLTVTAASAASAVGS